MIGISCTGFSASPPEEWGPKIAETFGLWEIFAEADHRIIGQADRFRSILQESGLRCQVHAPISDWNIGSMSERLRESSLTETLETIETAVELGAGAVTVHPGLTSMSVAGVESRAVEYAKKSVARIDRCANDCGAKVAIENMPSPPFFLGRTAEQLAYIVDGTDLGICFDIGHANTMGQIDRMIDTFGERIINIHIHDNRGEKDEHLTIGEGTIDFRRVIRRLSGYRGNWIIESKSLESGVQSFSRLEKLISRSGGIQFGMVFSDVTKSAVLKAFSAKTAMPAISSPMRHSEVTIISASPA